MNNIPKKLRSQMDKDPEYKSCARYGQHTHICEGRITREHAVIFAGKQVQEQWAIPPLCAKGHAVDGFQDGGDLDKHINLWIALNRASDAEIEAISKVINYRRERDRLNDIYGPYVRKYPSPLLGINVGIGCV